MNTTMNWLDYLRGYEEGTYDRRSGNTGLLGSLLQLLSAIIIVAGMFCWYCFKTIVFLLGSIVKMLIGAFLKR